MKVTLERIEDTTKNIRTFYFLPERPLRYIAGQFIELYLPHMSTDSRGDKRWFTLSSSPSDSHISITTALFGDQSSSFKRQLARLKPGSTAEISLPMGDFVLPKDPDIPIIFIAGGIGITPFKSILTELRHREHERRITLLHLAHSDHEFPFKHQLSELLGTKYIPITTGDHNQKHRSFSAELVKERTNPSKDHYIYISGPEPMVESLTNDLAKSGIERRHIFTDFFHGYVTD